jgi:DNA-binding response OmpR family regulator
MAAARMGRVAASVLIVDDDRSFHDLAARLLSAAGLDVVARADSAGAGLSAARGIKPDAILVDVMLPDRDGVELAGDLAALPWRPRVLLTSVSDEIAGGAEVDRSGAVDFIPKDALGRAPLELILGGAPTRG